MDKRNFYIWLTGKQFPERPKKPVVKIDDDRFIHMVNVPLPPPQLWKMKVGSMVVSTYSAPNVFHRVTLRLVFGISYERMIQTRTSDREGGK